MIAIAFGGTLCISAVPSRDCTPRALPRASRSGRHVGLRPPRNDKSVCLAPLNYCCNTRNCLRRSGSAATDAIGAHHFSIPGANCQYCSGRGTPLPYNGWCSRYIAANDKAAGDPPRPPRLPLSSPCQTECTASSGSRCNQNHGSRTWETSSCEFVSRGLDR